MLTAKSPLNSRTLWINAGLTLVFALGLVGQLAGILQIDPRYVALAGGVAAVINFALRLDTSVPIAGTPAASSATAGLPTADEIRAAALLHASLVRAQDQAAAPASPAPPASIITP